MGVNLAELIGGGLAGRKGLGIPGVRTPSTFPPNRGAAPPAGAGPPLNAPPVSNDGYNGYTPEDLATRDLIANPPQEGVKPDGTKIGKFRRIMGTIASVAGPLIGGPAVSGLGEKLLHPGLEDWRQKLARSQALSQMSDMAENRRNLQANRKTLEDEHTAAQKARDESSYYQHVGNIENHGGWEVPNAPAPVDLPVSQKLSSPLGIQEIQSTTPVQAAEMEAVTGKPLGQVGDVEEVAVPGGAQKKRFVRPNVNTRRDLAASDVEAKKRAEQTETLSDEEAQQLNDLGFSGNFKGQKMTPADARERRSAIQSRLNSRDTIASKPEPVSKQNENEWIATVNDPTSEPAAVTVAQANLKRLHDERMATRAVPDGTGALDRLGSRYGKPHEKSLTDADTQLEKIADARVMINGNAASQALGIPKILTALVSGAGSGVRITQAELNSIGNARGIAGDVEGFFRKVSGQGTLTPQQQQQFTQILDDVKARVLQKRAIASEALDNINGAQSREEIIRHDKEARKKLGDIATGGGSATPSPAAPAAVPQVGGTFNGGKVLKVTRIP